MIGNTVLIVVDQTQDADLVLREGLDLCSKLGVKPVILTTVQGSQAPQQATNKNLVNSLRERITHLTGSPDELEILTPTGDAAREIRRAAAAMGADLIIIGNHPEAGLGLFLGSTANVVLHETPCHVLAVTLRPS